MSMVSSQESETGAPKMCCDWRALGGTLRVIWGLDIFYRPWGYNGHMMSYSTFRSTIKDWNGAEDPILGHFRSKMRSMVVECGRCRKSQSRYHPIKPGTGKLWI